MSELDRFMAAIRRLESGSFEGNYSAIGSYTGSRYGRARGAYQIMETIWPGWAREAGIPGADWRDPAAQDRVARYKMSQYYRQYGSWDLVAAAWFGGPGAANEMKRRGTSGRRDLHGTSVPSYIQQIRRYMGDQGAATAARRTSAKSSMPLYASDSERLRQLAQQILSSSNPTEELKRQMQAQGPDPAADQRATVTQALASGDQIIDGGSSSGFVDNVLNAFSNMFQHAGAGRETVIDDDVADEPSSDKQMENMLVALLEAVSGGGMDPEEFGALGAEMNLGVYEPGAGGSAPIAGPPTPTGPPTPSKLKRKPSPGRPDAPITRF